MEKSDYALVLAAFFVAAAVGFAGHRMLGSGGEFTKEMDVRVDMDNQEATARFDNQTLELKYQNYQQAKFYFVFNDTRGEQQIEDLEYDGELHTTTEIRSFGNKTYLLYLRYQDNASEFDDGWMELYRVEEA
jgi:hypothetical protein